MTTVRKEGAPSLPLPGETEWDRDQVAGKEKPGVLTEGPGEAWPRVDQ